MADSLVHAKCAACFAQVVKWFPIDWLSLGHDVIIEQAGRPASRRVGSRLFIEVIARNDIRRGNMGIHQPSKEQASKRTNKDGINNVLNITYLDRRTNIWLKPTLARQVSFEHSSLDARVDRVKTIAIVLCLKGRSIKRRCRMLEDSVSKLADA
ncbi:hypothetical protein NP493_437g02007 [Ridgeia piscesae]|uniref:Uncharacterized protein n=1 Tax=Ridgeia piscesae TaxID=27915 RepID=A0AAD9NTY6_RIDPI|nr:hypothetical protein NP493_437g02007 [Ridgeia piscesae]